MVPLSPMSQRLAKSPAAHAVVGLLKGRRNAGVPFFSHVLRQLAIVAMPGVIFLLLAGFSYKAVTTVEAQARYDIEEIGATRRRHRRRRGRDCRSPPLRAGCRTHRRQAACRSRPRGRRLPPVRWRNRRAHPSRRPKPPPRPNHRPRSPAAAAPAAEGASVRPAPTWWWVTFAIFGALVTLFYLFLSFARLEIFKMLLASFFPLVLLILSVLGSIVMGLATPTEAAAMGALGGMLLAAAYRRLNLSVLKESVFLTAKTSAMVCWLFVGSAIFSAAFALLGGQALVEEWVLSMNLTKVQFLVLSQVIIFLLGWPLEWTEIIVIFMPIFIPLLDNFGVDPLFFGLLVAMNLQTAFLSPPAAMAAFYLKGVSPPHVTLNQIFLGMLPFMGIQVLAIVLLYIWPQIGLWLPQLLYK